MSPAAPPSRAAPSPPRKPGGEGTPAAARDVAELCAFRVGAEEYVLDIKRVREIIPPMKITTVPRAPEFIEGVINLRGTIIPVMDLRKRLSVPLTPATKKSKYLICMVGLRRVGLVVDEVTGVLRLPREAIKRAPSLLARKGPRFFLGACGPPERLKLLLNVKALLESSAKVEKPAVSG